MATVVMPLVFAARCTSGIPESGHGCAQRHTTRSRRPPSGTALNKAQPALAPSTGVRSIGQLPSQQGQIAAQADPPQHGQKTAAHGGQHTTDRAALMWQTRHATPTRDADTRRRHEGSMQRRPRYQPAATCTVQVGPDGNAAAAAVACGIRLWPCCCESRSAATKTHTFAPSC